MLLFGICPDMLLVGIYHERGMGPDQKRVGTSSRNVPIRDLSEPQPCLHGTSCLVVFYLTEQYYPSSFRNLPEVPPNLAVSANFLAGIDIDPETAED